MSPTAVVFMVFWGISSFGWLITIRRYNSCLARATLLADANRRLLHELFRRTGAGPNGELS